MRTFYLVIRLDQRGFTAQITRLKHVGVNDSLEIASLLRRRSFKIVGGGFSDFGQGHENMRISFYGVGNYFFKTMSYEVINQRRINRQLEITNHFSGIKITRDNLGQLGMCACIYAGIYTQRVLDGLSEFSTERWRDKKTLSICKMECENFSDHVKLSSTPVPRIK